MTADEIKEWRERFFNECKRLIGDDDCGIGNAETLEQVRAVAFDTTDAYIEEIALGSVSPEEYAEIMTM